LSDPFYSDRGFKVCGGDFPLFPGLSSVTDIGMVGGPGYEVERPSAWYAVSMLFSRECRGWAFEAFC